VVVSLEIAQRRLAAGETTSAEFEEIRDRLLGVHVLTVEGCEVIQAAVLAVRLGLRVADLVGTFFPYLTQVEGLKLAAQTFDKDLSKLSCCAARAAGLW